MMACSKEKRSNMDNVLSLEDESSSSLNRIQKFDKDRIIIKKVPYSAGAVVLMKHPTSLTLYKYVSVAVLSGTVSINGYEMTRKSHPVKVFSSEKTGLVEIKTEDFESLFKKKTARSTLESNLASICRSQHFIRGILEKFGQSTVAVHIDLCPLPLNVEFAKFYFREAFEYNLCKKSPKLDWCYLDKDAKAPVQFGEEEEKLASEIIALIRKAKVNRTENPKIVVFGPKNSGKSVLLQYLINKVLSQYERAFYLDTDPGQPEFSPPGCISFTKIKKPIFGPSFFHQKYDARMMFVADVSPNNLDLYQQNIAELMEWYDSDYNNDPLFVNTMGWMDSTGLEILKVIITTIEPTVLVEIVPKGEDTMFDYRDCIPSTSQYFQICCNHDRYTVFSSKEMRELSLISHLGKCQIPYLRAEPTNKVKPYCVSWQKIAIFVYPEESLTPNRVIEAICGSIVALCSVPETSIIRMPECAPILVSGSNNECLAYGLVVAVDERDELLYIIAPLKKDEWLGVNAIIIGKVATPDALVLKQEIYDEPLPFGNVDQPTLPDEETMETSTISSSIKHFEEVETEVSSSCENYRKPIGKRYQNSLNKYIRH